MYEKPVKIINGNIQIDNYQVDLEEFETSLQENSGLNNFDNSWWQKGSSHTLLQHILRTSFLRPPKIS